MPLPRAVLCVFVAWITCGAGLVAVFRDGSGALGVCVAWMPSPRERGASIAQQPLPAWAVVFLAADVLCVPLRVLEVLRLVWRAFDGSGAGPSICWVQSAVRLHP